MREGRRVSGLVRFDLLQMKAGMRRLCTCRDPKYSIDHINRIVECRECGAYVDPIDALVCIARRYERIDEHLAYVKEQSELIDAYKPRLKVIKLLEERYAGTRNALVPACPKCGEYFDLAELKHVGWQSKEYYHERMQHQERVKQKEIREAKEARRE